LDLSELRRHLRSFERVLISQLMKPLPLLRHYLKVARGDKARHRDAGASCRLAFV